MNTLYKLFLAFNSTFLIVVIFLIKERYYLICLEKLDFIYASWILFILFPVFLSYLSFYLVKCLPNDEIKNGTIDEIELANSSFLPTYLGYFFVALSIADISTLIVIFLILYVFTYLSQNIYFNPLFLLFGYHFYFVKTKDHIKYFIITKQHLKDPKNIGFSNLKRINNYTFIEL